MSKVIALPVYVIDDSQLAAFTKKLLEVDHALGASTPASLTAVKDLLDELKVRGIDDPKLVTSVEEALAHVSLS